MPADLLADSIISELQNELGTGGDSYSESTPTVANKAIAKAITDYLKQNTTITVSYVGVIPTVPPVPDPLVTDVFKIIGECAPVPVATNFDTWLIQLATNIQTGFQLQTNGVAALVCGTPTLCFMGITPFIGNQITLGLKELHKSNSDNPQKAVWTAICDVIWTWLNTMVVPTPFLCTNPLTGSTGTGMIAKITVQ